MQTQVSSDQVPVSGGTEFGIAGLIVTVTTQRWPRVVHLGGELDIAARSAARDACIGGGDHDVVVDLGDLTFMDSRGYDALISARESLRQRGLTMTLRNLGGQPARLVGLLSVLDARAGHFPPEHSPSASTQGVSVCFTGSALG